MYVCICTYVYVLFLSQSELRGSTKGRAYTRCSPTCMLGTIYMHSTYIHNIKRKCVCSYLRMLLLLLLAGPTRGINANV